MKKIALGMMALGLLVVGCTKTLDNAELEKKIMEDGVAKGWPIKTVSCPSGKPFKAGDTFDCTTTFEGGKSTVTAVAQKDGEGSLSWETKDLVPTKDIADVIAQNNGGAEVTCPHKVVIAKEGDKFDCSAAHGTEKLAFEVTIGKDGHFSASPKGAAQAHN